MVRAATVSKALLCIGWLVSPEWESYTAPVAPKEPLLTSDALFEQDGDVCGEDCFRLVDSDDMVRSPPLLHTATYLIFIHRKMTMCLSLTWRFLIASSRLTQTCFLVI